MSRGQDGSLLPSSPVLRGLLSSPTECAAINSFRALRWLPDSQQYMDIMFKRVQDVILQDQMQYLIESFLYCFSYLEPEYLLEGIFSIIQKKMLKARTDPEGLKSIQSSALYFLLQHTGLKEKILEYEIAITNTESILWYLSLIENALTYARSHIRKYTDTLEIVVYLCIFSEEGIVFERACDIIHTIVITSSFILPEDIYYISPKQARLKSSKYYYLKSTGSFQLKNLDLTWSYPTPEDLAYMRSWVDRFLYVIMDYYQTKYFGEDLQLLNYRDNFTELVDLLMFPKTDDIPSKKEHFRLMFLVLAVFSAFNIRVPNFTSDKV